MSFILHPRLEADTLELGTLPLCRVRLMNDCRFPWLVLVPAREGVREIHQLADRDRSALIEEIALASAALESIARPDKMNIGALGNVVDQLHVHVIARRTGDAAWPGPVWGAGVAVPYAPADAEVFVTAVRQAIPGLVQEK